LGFGNAGLDGVGVWLDEIGTGDRRVVVVELGEFVS
jgi:hypothetical protein